MLRRFVSAVQLPTALGRRAARLHINALSAANAELDAMAEFSQATKLAAQDRLPAARDRMSQSLSFLAYAPKPLTVAALIRLARVERDTGDAAAEVAKRRLVLSGTADVGDASLSAFASATFAFSLLLDGRFQECDSFAQQQIVAFSSKGNIEGEYHMLVMRALSLWHQSSDACAPSATPVPASDASADVLADVLGLLKQALAAAMRLAAAEPHNTAAIRHAGDASTLIALVSSSSDLTFKLAQQQLENDAVPLLQKHAPTVTVPSASPPAVAAADDVTVGLVIALTELAAVQVAREDDKGAFETLSRALKLASARFDADDVRLVWCLGPLASACMRVGNTIEAEGLFRSSLSKLRAARPMTSAAQVALLRTSRDFATMLAHVSWNGRSREPEGRALLADENERAAARFRHGALMVSAAQAQVAAAVALVGKLFPEKTLAESSGEGTFRIARFLNMPVRQLPLWLLDKYR